MLGVKNLSLLYSCSQLDRHVSPIIIIKDTLIENEHSVILVCVKQAQALVLIMHDCEQLQIKSITQSLDVDG